MKAIGRWSCGALLSLSVLALIVPVVRADEMADWLAEMRRQNEEFHRKAQEDREALDRFNREAQEAREAMDRYNQQVQAEREASDRAYREAQEAREAMDRYNQQVQEARDAQDKYYRERDLRDAQQERDAWDKWNREMQEWRDSQQKQQEWEDWSRNLWGSADWSAAGSNSNYAIPQPLVILNPFALEKMKPQDQERVRQQATQMNHPIMQSSQRIMKNPFVRSSK